LPNHEIGNLAIWQFSVIKLQLSWSQLCLINGSSLLEYNREHGFEIMNYNLSLFISLIFSGYVGQYLKSGFSDQNGMFKLS